MKATLAYLTRDDTMLINTEIIHFRETRMRVLKIALLIAILFAPATSQAESDYKPITKVENLTGYFLFTRCAGLMTALSYWMGSDAKDKTLQSNVMDSTKLFTALAIKDGINSTTDINALRAQTVKQVMVTRNMYLDRFRDNFAAGGQGYGDDNEVKSDILLCQYAKENVLNK